MSYLLDVILCSGVVAAELIGIFAGALLIQGLVYRTTKFSIYNYAKKKLITDQLSK